jgi:hypothetical protein
LPLAALPLAPASVEPELVAPVVEPEPPLTPLPAVAPPLAPELPPAPMPEPMLTPAVAPPPLEPVSPLPTPLEVDDGVVVLPQPAANRTRTGNAAHGRDIWRFSMLQLYRARGWVWA